MSRIGRSPIAVPSNVTVTLSGDNVNVKGPQGTLERRLPQGITIAQEGDMLVVSRPDDERRHRALHGLCALARGQHGVGRHRGLHQGARDRRRRLPRHDEQPGRSRALARFLPPGLRRCPRGDHLRGVHPHPRDGARDRQGEGRPGSRRTSGRSVSPSRTRARVSGMSARSSVVRPERPGSNQCHPLVLAKIHRLRTRRHDRVRAKVHRHRRAATLRGLPLEQARRCPGHQRRPRSDDRRCFMTVEADLRRRGRPTGERHCRQGGAHATFHDGTRAKAKGVSTVVFDRGGFVYHGRVAVLADAHGPRDWSSEHG